MKVDSHFHVFGEGYPYAPDLRYKPPHAPLSDYFAHMKPFGFDRFVFVQPSAYGRDNACMLDAMREVGPGKCRGIVDIDQDAPDSLLNEMDSLGVCGVRVNVNPIKPPEPGFSKSMMQRIHTLDAKCAELGWMLDFLTPGWLTHELLPVFGKLKSRYSVAHMGMFLAREGVSERFREFIACVKDSDGWVKLTGVYRMSTAPGFKDAAPFARELVAKIPDRLIWGSDYPHLSFHDKVTTEGLYGLLEEWSIPKDSVLGKNPASCFRF